MQGNQDVVQGNKCDQNPPPFPPNLSENNFSVKLVKGGGGHQNLIFTTFK